MADILSQDEIDSILSRTEGKPAKPRNQQMPENPPHRIVTSYDFKHPARVNKDQLRTLENLHANFARLLSSTFSGVMRSVVEVNTAFVDQTTYAEFIMSLSNPSSSYEFSLGPTSGQAILDVAMPLTFGFVDRMLGGKGSSQGVDARQLSQVEMALTASIIRRVIEDLEATWEPILPVEISDIMLETNPEFMQITAASEIVILLAFEVKSPHAAGLISLCYPFFTLESILPMLGRQSYVRTQCRNPDDHLRQNRLRLGQTSLPLAAELGRGQLTVAEARGLQVGDTVVLETGQDEPVVLYLDDRPKWVGVPFVGPHGHLTVKVAAEIPAAEEETYRARSRPVAPLA